MVLEGVVAVVELAFEVVLVEVVVLDAESVALVVVDADEAANTETVFGALLTTYISLFEDAKTMLGG